MKYYLGIDIGGTKCAISLGNFNGDIDGIEILEREEIRTEGTWKDVIDKLINIAITYKSKYKIASCGISCGGPLDSKKGLILSPPNLPNWDNVPICDYIFSKINIPCYLQNDANACAIAEWKFGAGKGYNNVVFLTFGTGFGAGLILDGKLFEGKDNLSGEIGHVRLSENGPKGYNKYGSVEGYCSGSGIVNLAKIILEKNTTPSLMRTASELNAKIIAEFAEKGDELSIAVYRESGKRLGQALAIINDLINPELIIIGSIFTRSENLIRPYMEAELKKESLSEVKIVKADLGNQVGDYAAISLAVYNDSSIINELLNKYPKLDFLEPKILEAYEILKKAYLNNKKALICGNGGSASDSEHIVGELMKGFLKERHYESGLLPGKRLQKGLRAISLVSQSSLISAIANDNGADLVFAQQVLGYGDCDDVFIGLSTSGNSENVVLAAKMAKELNMKTIAFTGENGGKLKDICDVTINVPSTETFKIQEYHLPIYHSICALLEDYFF